MEVDKMKTITNGKGLTAIYVRRSVSDSYKGNNSLSINAQKEECIRFVGDEPYRIAQALQLLKDKLSHIVRLSCR